VILIDQLREIYIDAVLEPVETPTGSEDLPEGLYDRDQRHESGVDDPDQQFYENFVCGAVRNYTGYCNREVDKLIDQQSAESNVEKRKQLSGGSSGYWPRRAPADHLLPARRNVRAGSCQSLTTMVNSIYNGYRMEDVWLDK